MAPSSPQRLSSKPDRALRACRRAGWALAAWCGLGACSGGYPLPPTRCDEWCEAKQPYSCAGSYDPADCVSICEEAGGIPGGCRTQLDAVIACYHGHPQAAAAQCSGSPEALICAAADQELANCALWITGHG